MNNDYYLNQSRRKSNFSVCLYLSKTDTVILNYRKKCSVKPQSQLFITSTTYYLWLKYLRCRIIYFSIHERVKFPIIRYSCAFQSFDTNCMDLKSENINILIIHLVPFIYNFKKIINITTTFKRCDAS